MRAARATLTACLFVLMRPIKLLFCSVVFAAVVFNAKTLEFTGFDAYKLVKTEVSFSSAMIFDLDMLLSTVEIRLSYTLSRVSTKINGVKN